MKGPRGIEPAAGHSRRARSRTSNRAAQTLADAIYNDLKAGKKVNVTGYSQGGAIVSSASREVDNRLNDDMGGF